MAPMMYRRCRDNSDNGSSSAPSIIRTDRHLAAWRRRPGEGRGREKVGGVNERSVRNEHGQPVGLPVPGWTPRAVPRPDVLVGRYCRVEAREPARHDDALFDRLHAEPGGARWTYISLGPFPHVAAMAGWLDGLAGTPGTFPTVIVVTDAGSPAGGADSPTADLSVSELSAGSGGIPSGRLEGTASYMRTDVTIGTVEVGSIVYSPALQRSRAATEAMYLLARHAFELGYRRYEWKCDALNGPSRAAAGRLGFAFEGVWRNALVYKGRNRDTAWYAITDADWAALAPVYEAWLDPANFDAAGRQRVALSAGTDAVRARLDR
jgi:RimJ/RimL family protein N-acetyltransferase